MTEADDVRWLSDREMSAWRSYMVATVRLRHQLHRELADTHELSLADYEVLVCLSSAEDYRQRMTELAGTVGATKSRLSHQIGRMEQEGLVRRERDAADKRGVVAVMTDQGAKLLETAAPTHVGGVREHMIDHLAPEEQVVLAESFFRIFEHLASLDG